MSENAAVIGEDALQAYIDGRLDDKQRALVEAYLAEHPELRDRVMLDRRHREALRAQLAGKFAEPVPERLRVAGLRGARREARRRRARALAAAAAIFLFGMLGGWMLDRLQTGMRGSAAGAVARNATAAYRTFVVEVAHPVEVPAANEAHLLKWLSKRLGRPLSAPDLARFGYRLMGGRLLPSGSGAAAQLMYDDPLGKRLTVYVQAGQGSATAFRFVEQGGASSFVWVDRGFGFAVTARTDRGRLLPIAEAVYRSFGGDRNAVSDGNGRS